MSEKTLKRCMDQDLTSPHVCINAPAITSQSATASRMIPLVAALIIILSLILPQDLKGQFLDNNLNIGVFAGGRTSLNGGSVKLDGFSYPSLFGNFASVPELGGFMEYKLNGKIWTGICLSEMKFQTWTGNSEVFILENPGFSSTSVDLSISWHSTLLTIFPWKLEYYLTTGPILSFDRVSWTSIDVLDEFSNDNDRTYTNTGWETGAGLQMNINNELGVKLQASYRYLHQNSILFEDKAFNSVRISLGVYKKLIKNINYKYE